jgi:prepilin-type N-terminal cleavage/methylation domain-containing protein
MSARSRGFTLVEVLITIVVLAGVFASTVTFLRSQNQSFLDTSRRLDALQNARFALSQVERELRTLGAGVPGQQPMLVYGNTTVIAFNTDYVENDSSSFRWATYYNPNVTDLASQAWLLANAAVIPNSSYSYPPATYTLGNGGVSPAETHIFWLAPDSSTTRTDDYILWQRINNGEREVVSRNLLQMGSKPFFEYFLARRLTTGADTLLITPSALLPLIRRPLTSGMTATDTANAVRPDSIQSVRVNFRVTNGLTGADERIRDVSTVVAVPNNGLILGSVCGRTPFPVASFGVTPDVNPGSGRVDLAWNASPDQEGGEVDVRQYVIYRRVAGATLWEDPVMNLARNPGVTSYAVSIGGHVSGTTYDFAVAAQDCTPATSTLVTGTVTAP